MLGDGLQQKSYLYVKDCIAAILLAADHHADESGTFIYNLGHEETLLVRDSVQIITKTRIDPEISYGGGQRGWIGDSPLFSWIRPGSGSLGWGPTKSIRESVELTVEWLEHNPSRGRRITSEKPHVSVILSRAPLRISLGGGGTDLPSYYRNHDGFVLAGAIDKYVYMLIHDIFQRRYRMKYSAIEEVDTAEEIQHPILREVLVRHWKGNPLEIASVADVPAGTGMGSSGAFTVCLLRGLAYARRTTIAPGPLAEAACEIEIDVLREPVGKQDQYVAAHGGICATPSSATAVSTSNPRARPVDPPPPQRPTAALLHGVARSASQILSDQDRRSLNGETEMIENLHLTKELGGRAEICSWRRRRGLCGPDARALDAEAGAIPRDRKRSDRLPLRDCPKERRHRRKVGGSRRRWLPSRVRGPPRRDATTDGRRVPRNFPSISNSAVHMHRSMHDGTKPLRVGIVGCGLIGRKRAEALGRTSSSGVSMSYRQRRSSWPMISAPWRARRLNDLSG